MNWRHCFTWCTIEIGNCFLKASYTIINFRSLEDLFNSTIRQYQVWSDKQRKIIHKTRKKILCGKKYEWGNTLFTKRLIYLNQNCISFTWYIKIKISDCATVIQLIGAAFWSSDFLCFVAEKLNSCNCSTLCAAWRCSSINIASRNPLHNLDGHSFAFLVGTLTWEGNFWIDLAQLLCPMRESYH